MTESGEGDRAARWKAVVEEHVRFENAHDLEGIMSTFGEGAFYDDAPWNDRRAGEDGVRAYYGELIQAAPDLHIHVERTHIGKEALVLEVRITGTHLGSWRGLPGTGKRLDFPLCGIFTFDANDRLEGERIYYDRATVLRQLGVFFEPTTSAGKLLTPLCHPLTMLGAIGRSLGRKRGPPPPGREGRGPSADARGG